MGTAALDGTLTITLVNGYVPGSGDAFQILSFAFRGTPPTDFATRPDRFDLNYDDIGGSLTVVMQ